MERTLNRTPLGERLSIVICGTGGTGGFVAEGLCRLLTGMEADILLVDPDRVERHNLLRQNFHQADIGRYKSETLAVRLAKSYNRPIAYSNSRFEGTNRWAQPGMSEKNSHLLIGCVDNGQARRAMHALAQQHAIGWLVDAGNGRDWGQVLIGNTTQADEMAGAFTGDTIFRLPAPGTQRPDVLVDAPEEEPEMDCARAIDLLGQDPLINQTMANLTLQAVKALITGTCNYMALYTDTARMRTHAVPATPRNAAKAAGIEERLLTKQEWE